MRRMTCRNGFVFVAAIGLGLMVTCARAGTNNFLVVPASPTNPASAMFTLNDIYNKLDTRASVSIRTNAFTEPTNQPTNGTMHTLADIMALVTNRAPVPKTGQTTSYAVGDDGANRLGVASPIPRFTVLGNTNVADDLTNCVRDNLTGLIWARNANIAFNSAWSASGTVTWSNAFEVISNLSSGLVNKINYGGTNDWRLPNTRELFSLMDLSVIPTLPAGHPFVNTSAGTYHTSTTTAGTFAPTYMHIASFNSGYCGIVGGSTKTTLLYVWPVRGGL